MTSVSKNVHIDKLDDIINKYNNTHHSTIKMKHIDAMSSTYVDFNKRVMKKILNLKLVLLLEYQNIKTFLQKVTLQIGLRKSLWLKKLKILCSGLMLLFILMEKELLELLEKKLLKSQKGFKIEKILKKGDKCESKCESWIRFV